MKENPDIQPKQQIPLKICYPSHHSDVTDAMKKNRFIQGSAMAKKHICRRTIDNFGVDVHA